MQFGKKIIIFVLSIFFSLLLFGCTGKGSDNLNEELPNADEPLTGYESLEEFYNDPLNSFMLKAMEKTIANTDDSLYDFKITVQGNRMIYEMHSKVNQGKQQSYYERYFESQKDDLFKQMREDIDLEADYEVEYIIYNDDYSKCCDVVLKEGQLSDKEIKEELKKEYEENKKQESKTSDKTVEDYYNEVYGPGYMDYVAQSFLTNYKDVYSDVRMECEGNSVTFSYYFINDYGDGQAEVEKNLTDDDKKRIISDIKIPAGVTDTVTIKYIYYNPDGSVSACLEFEG